jgi:hypothetical protein
MARLAGWTRLLLINLAVAAVLLEAASLAAYALQRHGLYYLRPAAPPTAAQPAEAAVTSFRLSPYFGFMREPRQPLSALLEPQRLALMAAPAKDAPWAAVRTNNLGFLSPHDHPYTPPEPDAYVVAVFGGSVAQWFALQGAQTLAASPALAGRRLVLLNFANASYKQPQQALLLQFLLASGQRLDAVVNIDGFNEIALGAMNADAGVSVAMPSVQNMAPLAALAPLDADETRLSQLAELYGARRRLVAAQTGADTHGLATGWAFDRLRAALLARRVDTLAQALSSAKPAASLVALLPATDPTAALDQAVQLWARSSTLMRQTLAARGIPYLHVVQPNQYHGSRPMSQAEARIARSSASVYAKYVVAGYPKLLEAARSLQAGGENLLDATTVFDATAETVYADDCCHYNQRGNELLARAVAQALHRP